MQFVRFLLFSMPMLAMWLPGAVNAQESYSAAHQAVEDVFRSSQESTAKDALWTDKSVFKVGVHDNGSRRDGYAEYVCIVLYDHGFKGKRVLVRVIDIDQLIQSGEWVNLGTSMCQ